MNKLFLQIVLVLVIVYWLAIFLLTIKNWDWLAEHPSLFMSRGFKWMGEDMSTPKYDMDIKKGTKKKALFLVVFGVIVLLITFLL